MFRSDLYEGLCVGHAPKQCRTCGRRFLTINARPTKYCNGYAPGDKRHRSCRQVGNLKGRKERELAEGIIGIGQKVRTLVWVVSRAALYNRCHTVRIFSMWWR